MKRLVILCAGTAGTMMANHLNHELDREEWEIDIIDEREEHYYQPGYLFLPFDIYEPEDIIKPIREFIPKRVRLLTDKIMKVDADKNFLGQLLQPVLKQLQHALDDGFDPCLCTSKAMRHFL